MFEFMVLITFMFLSLLATHSSTPLLENICLIKKKEKHLSSNTIEYGDQERIC